MRVSEKVHIYAFVAKVLNMKGCVIVVEEDSEETHLLHRKQHRTLNDTEDEFLEQKEYRLPRIGTKVILVPGEKGKHATIWGVCKNPPSNGALEDRLADIYMKMSEPDPTNLRYRQDLFEAAWANIPRSERGAIAKDLRKERRRQKRGSYPKKRW